MQGVLLSSTLSTSSSPSRSSSTQEASTTNPVSSAAIWQRSALMWAFEVPRAVLKLVAALLANQQWQALQALLSRGLSHHLVSMLDSLSRDPSNGALEGVEPPAMLCARRPVVQAVRQCQSSSCSVNCSAPSASLDSSCLRPQQLRLLHEGLVLLSALLNHRCLAWSVLDDLTSSNATFRACVTTMTRLTAAQTTNAKAASHHQQEDAAPVGLAQWAVELQRKRGSLAAPLQPRAPLLPGGKLSKLWVGCELGSSHQATNN